MKKFTLLAGLFLAMVVTVTAQSTATKVSKEIKVFDWLNAAVVDGNQVEGGLHSYASWAEVSGATAKLKIAQVKLGMVVIIADGSRSISYRLKAWTTKTALPLISEWERVGDVISVTTTAARDALLTTTGSAVGTAAVQGTLAVGTMVFVTGSNGSAPDMYIYVGGLIDANGDGTVKPVTATELTDAWYSLSGASAASGYVYVEVQDFTTSAPTVPGTSTANAYTYDSPATLVIPASTNKKFTQVTLPVGGFSYDLVANLAGLTTTKVPVVYLPAAWGKPSFYIYDGTNYFQLQDCWVKNFVTMTDGAKYQVWTADNNFAFGATGTLNLVIR